MEASSYINVETQRATTENTIHLNPAAPGANKQADYLVNYDNMVPNTTQREINPTQPNANVKGNYTAVPLVNFLNFIPEVTLKEILLEDNGRKNLTNVSNSLKSYLFNSINSIPDTTLREIIADKIIIANQKGNSENGYLFNSANAVPQANMLEYFFQFHFLLDSNV